MRWYGFRSPRSTVPIAARGAFIGIVVCPIVLSVGNAALKRVVRGRTTDGMARFSIERVWYHVRRWRLSLSRAAGDFTYRSGTGGGRYVGLLCIMAE